MKWFNLKNNKCPQCSKALYGYSCPCGFRISEKRWKEIVADMNQKDHEDRGDFDSTDFEDENFIARN